MHRPIPHQRHHGALVGRPDPRPRVRDDVRRSTYRLGPPTSCSHATQCENGHVNSAHIESVAALGDRDFVAAPLMEGEQSNVRVIRIAPGQALPPHRHGQSDLMLYVVAGTGELETASGPSPFSAGTLACFRGDEELRVRNVDTTRLTLLAFLAPKFATS